jgi:hypothetical protein
MNLDSVYNQEKWIPNSRITRAVMFKSRFRSGTGEHTMVVQSPRFARLSRAVFVLGLLFGSIAVYGQIVLGQGLPTGTGAPSVIGMTWPNGVELLAGHQLDLDAGDYEWRISTREAPTTPGEPVETGNGVVVAVSGSVLIERNESEIVRLERGAALTVGEGDSLVVVSDGEDPADFLLIELVEVSAPQPGNETDVVGPLTVQGGGHAMVLLNVPVAVTIDVTLDEIIDGSLRPAVSIAHTDNEIPETISASRNYDRWIVALFPPEEAPVVTEATSAPTSAPEVVPSPTTAPSMPASPTATATATATATETATNTPTSTPTETPVPATEASTVTPTNTMVPPTEAPAETPTETPVTPPPA